MTLSSPPPEPMALFDQWYDEAHAHPEIRYAHAMNVATVDASGDPDARTLLLKHVDEMGFVFFTDAESPTGQALDLHPTAALTFYWGPIERQVRIRGRVEVASTEVSDRCFAARPRQSQITAWASRQSEPLADPGDLEEAVESMGRRFEGVDTVPRPARWLAYRVVPARIEFWEARSARLHERVAYERIDEGWRVVRLQP